MVNQEKTPKPLRQSAESGQALLEYALILILVVIALSAALIATGPALGNVFSNTVYNLIGQNGTPQQDLSTRGSSAAFWLTVTAVASNPPSDRVVPVNPPQPPPLTSTPGPSPTPTPITPSPTYTFTPTVTISPTPQDIAHEAPFVDPIDHPEWWRVDSSVWLGGDDWRGEYYPNRDLIGKPVTDDPDVIKYNGQISNAARFNINFDWGTGGPLDPWKVDEFSVRWTRNIYVFGTSPLVVNFNILSDEGVRLCVDSVAAKQSCASVPKLIDSWAGRTFDDGPLTASTSFAGGATADAVTRHTITLEYFEATGSAGIFMDISSFKGNVMGDGNNCQWARATGSQPNTISWAWEESGLAGNGFPPNMVCNLELRGYVDLVTLGANPQLTFWEVWDFAAAASSQIQIAEYAPYTYSDAGTPGNPSDDVVGGGPNWSNPLTSVTIPLRSGGKNYAWTQNTVQIPAGLVGKKITYRIKLSSGTGSGVRRYYIDDIEIRNPNARTFTVYCGNPATCPDGANYNLDTTGQKNDFITTGRWDLTSTNTAENSLMSFDVSKSTGSKYARFGPEQGSGDLRIHAVEFNGNINLTSIQADGTGGLPDFEGDDGFPQLTFYHAYDLDAGESLELQWTRDVRDAVPDNWQTITSFVTGPTTAAMDQVSVLLNSIPSWNSSPFRLRFAFKVNDSANNRAGWYIDSIVLDRKGRPRYGNYPFCEDAENGHTQWLFSGQWGESTVGSFGSSRSYADSPLGNYIVGQETTMEQKYVIDYNNDSPENFVAPNNGNRDCSGNPSGAAVKPYLTFWHYRSLGSNHTITVDLFRPANAASGTTQINWTPIWTYNYNGATRTQLAWERIQIDIQSSIEALTVQTWTQLTGGANTNKYDDDFMFRVRIDTRSGSGQGDGVYVDNINLRNYTESSHKLWDFGKTVTVAATEPTAGAGEGTRFVDDVDSPTEWWLRWNTGGDWTAIDWDAHSGLRSFHDHPDQGTSYKDKQFSILEMNEVIDLRGTLTTDQPTLYYWNRYAIGDGDGAGVQIAIEDKTRTTQSYDYIRGWGSSTSYGSPYTSSWQTIGSPIAAKTRVDTWIRQQIDLSAFADNPATPAVNEGKRIRLRFVLNTYSTSTGLTEGWWIDDVVVQFRQPRVLGLPFFDAAQNTSNWITEGTWGLAPDKWRGAGGGPAALGNDPYDAYYFDCIKWGTQSGGAYNPPARVPPPGLAADLVTTSCDPANTDRFLNSIPRVQTAPGANNDMVEWLAARPSFPVLTGATSTVNYEFGSTGRPPGAPAGAAGNTWDNDYMARWYRDITVLAGEYTFITTSDDGVRLRYDTQPPSTATTGTADWNIINKWTLHGRTLDFNTVTLAAGTYQLILEWFESTSGATIVLQVGNNNFSFSDSPKAGASPAIPNIPSVAYGNSSLMLDALLNLNNPGIPVANWIPRLQYYTYYDLGASNNAVAEVTIDGGFSWTTANLSNNCPSGAQCGSTISGQTTYLPPQGDWQLRSHDLRTYVNKNIGLRFRLLTTSSVLDGWWITEIAVNN